jgi:lipopolysaccharide transport protein LptA
MMCSVLAAQDEAPETRTLVLDSDSLTIDRKSNLIHLRGPRITQEDMSIRADEALATSLDFEEQSEWQFSGNVRIEVDAAVLEADSAVFAFADDRLSRAELRGNPASITDMSTERREPVRGSANRLFYDYVERTLRLTDNVWLYKGRNEIQGCDLIYDFKDEGLTSGSSDCGVRVRVLPAPEEDSTNDSADAP